MDREALIGAWRDCIDGVLVLFDTEQKGLSGVLVDNRKHAVRCAGQEVPQEVK